MFFSSNRCLYRSSLTENKKRKRERETVSFADADRVTQDDR